MTISVRELDIAWNLVSQRRFDDALHQSSLILERYPKNVSALVCNAMANWQNAGPIERSLSQMRQAIELAPNESTVRHNYASLLASTGAFDEAVEQFRYALRLRPDDPLAFFGLSQNGVISGETELIRSMVGLYERGALDDRGQEYLAFGLAKTFDVSMSRREPCPMRSKAMRSRRRASIG